MEHNFKALQNENYQLREYILSLQSRLLETQSDYPPAPAPSQVQSLASSSAAVSANHAPEPANAIDQRLRREMHPPHEPSPSQAQHDAISQLRAAAAHADAPQHQSPYGLGEEYPHKRVRPEEAGASHGDSKAPQ